MENDFAGVPRDAGEILPVTNIFGKYELGRLLGCGAFAKVYHAKNVRTGQSVAIKSISKQRLAKGNLVAHVKREIYIMRRMRHPHIVKLFEVLATRTKVYFVMEFAKGGELFAKVAKGRFSEDLSRRYFQQLISAVRYCHARGVFHRDLKPENLLLDENWELKVSDFGLSAVAEQIGPDGMLHTLCGTPAYVAPEVLAKKGYDGSKVDVWSCGVVLYVLNVGYLPFNDTNLMVMYRKIYKGEFRCPRWLSPDLKRLLSRLLDTSPDTRITIDEITRDPWFRNGHGEIKPLALNLAEDFDFKEKNINSDGANHMNAFDLISLSPSLNLSRLFGETDIPANSERFLSTETPERIIEKVREVADSEEVKMTTNSNRGIKLEGENGNFIFLLEIYRLMDNLVVVEVKKWAYEVGSCRGLWKDKLWPQLSGLIYQPDASVTGS